MSSPSDWQSILPGPSSITEATSTTGGSDSKVSMSEVVRDAADSLAELVSQQMTNNTALSAVIEVKLETVIVNDTQDGGGL